MAKKKDSQPASFQYFAGAAGNNAEEQPPAVAAVVRTEEEQIAENVRVFLEKRPPAPWLKPEDKPARAHRAVELPVEGSS